MAGKKVARRPNVPSRILAAILIVAGPCSALATRADFEPQERDAVASGSAWSWEVMPYFWAAGIDGKVTQFGLPPVEVEMSFSDIFDTIEFGAMIVNEWRKGPVGIFSDLTYVKTADSSGTPLGIVAAGVGIDQETLALTVAGTYRFQPHGWRHLDAIAGLRAWSVDTVMSFQGGMLDGIKASDGDTWVDPVLGLKGRYHATPRVILSSWAIVGGFGVSSDFMWDVMAAVAYEFSEAIIAGFGYRAFSVDFESGGFVFDIVQQGPTLGVLFRF